MARDEDDDWKAAVGGGGDHCGGGKYGTTLNMRPRRSPPRRDAMAAVASMFASFSHLATTSSALSGYPGSCSCVVQLSQGTYVSNVHTLPGISWIELANPNRLCLCELSQDKPMNVVVRYGVDEEGEDAVDRSCATNAREFE
jgi:hypothetical protein